jgi:hypothetical protein
MLSLGVAQAILALWETFAYIFGPPLTMTLWNISTIVAATATVDLLHSTTRSAGSSRRIDVVCGILLSWFLIALLWLDSQNAAIPRLDSHSDMYHAASRFALGNWAIHVLYVGYVLARAAWICAHQAREITFNPLHNSLKLISLGAAAGFAYEVTGGMTVALWHFSGPHPRWVTTLGGLPLLSLSLFFIYLGTNWAVFWRWHETRLARQQVKSIRPFWSQFMKSFPEISPFRDSMEGVADTYEMLHWQRTRMVIEVYDALLQISSYVDMTTRRNISALVAELGLHNTLADLAADRVCVIIGTRNRQAGGLPLPDPYVPELAGETTAVAAVTLSQRSRLARKRKVRRVVRLVSESF